jgi:CRISPR-associated protein Csb2
VFAIAIELLAGRYTATQFNDRSQPEWPPHPARLYSAMVATWADSDTPDASERAALRWLEDQSAPTIHCGEDHRRTVVTHFVPVNDATALTRDLSGTYLSMESAHDALAAARQSNNEKAAKRAQSALAKATARAAADAAKAGAPTGKETGPVRAGVLSVLPENRGKQGRTYPTVIPAEPVVWFVWPDAEPSSDDRQALDGLLSRVARIGHSSTLVACRCADREPPIPVSWLPGGPANEKTTRLRVPRSGLIDRLERAFETHHGEEPRTLPAGMINYHPPGKIRTQARVPLLGGDWYVLGIKGKDLPYAAQALSVTRAARNALLAHGDQPSPEILSGHQQVAGADGPTPPLKRPHLAIVPLLNAGNAHSDGTIFAVALILPGDRADDGGPAVERALRAWAAAGLELLLPASSSGRSNRFKLEDLGVDRVSDEPEPAWLNTALANRRTTTTREYWCRPASRWLTVTPIALDQFPGNLRSPKPATRDRAAAEAATAVARACVFAGLADKPEEVKVSIRLDAPLVGVPASPTGRRTPGLRQFPGYQTGSGVPRACVHAEITFPQPVRGPVLLGAGRYLGYGLCLPRELKAETER